MAATSRVLRAARVRLAPLRVRRLLRPDGAVVRPPWYDPEHLPAQHMTMPMSAQGAAIEPCVLDPPGHDCRGEWGHLGPMDFAVRVGNLDAAAAALEAEGVQLHGPPQRSMSGRASGGTSTSRAGRELRRRSSRRAIEPRRPARVRPGARHHALAHPRDARACVRHAVDDHEAVEAHAHAAVDAARIPASRGPRCHVTLREQHRCDRLAFVRVHGAPVERQRDRRAALEPVPVREPYGVRAQEPFW